MTLRTVSMASSVALMALSTACTQPDVSAEITAASTLLEEVDTRLRPSLEAVAASELATAEAALMQAEQQVISLEGPCDLAALEELMEARLDCRLVNNAVLPDTASATTTLEAITVMRSYLAALKALATSESPAAVQANAEALSAALSKNGAERVAVFRSLATVFEGRDQALAEPLGFLARQRQAAGLRRAVREADSVVAELTAAAVAYYRLEDVEIARRYEELLLAADHADDSGVLADPAANRRATDVLRSAYAAYRAAEAASPVSDFIAFRRLHKALHDRLLGLATPEEALALVTELQTVLTAIEGEG